tara:strand:- start:3361 stop:5079 length:1719 start_codon:yes stop_codon:yes gene_type:complete
MNVVRQKFTYRIQLIFMFLLLGGTYGQEDCKKIIEKLKTLDTNEQIKEFYAFEGTSSCDKLIANFLSEKTKKDKDSLNLSKVYAIMSYRMNPEFSIIYSDSLISMNDHQDDYYYIDKYYIRGTVYYYLEDPYNAIKELNRSYELAKKEENLLIETQSLLLLATIKSEQDGNDEALEVFHKALNRINKMDVEMEDQKNFLLTEALESLTIYHLFRKNIDSTFHYIDKLKGVLENFDDSETAQSIIILEGEAEYFSGNYSKALPLLQRARKFSNGIELLDILYYIGMCQKYLNLPEAQLQTFLEFESILISDKISPLPQSKEVFMFLLNESIKSREQDKQLFYYDKIITIDSLLKTNKQKMATIDIPGYSIEEIKNNKQVLLDKIGSKSINITILTGLLFLLLGVLSYYLYQYKKAKKQLSDYLDISYTNKNEEKSSKKSIGVASNEIDSELASSYKIALHKLNTWESEKGFLDKDVDLNVLSNLFLINRTYISKAVNIYKGKKFRNYITDLRMEYFIETTKANFNHDNKSLIRILEDFGFNSIDTFSRALKAKLNNNNVTPAMYMKEIKKRNS